ncbi:MULTISPECIES: hypothetical protein [unclassified Brucella]|uniref:hypothetical protein n=1 Tax=unclassified Brucella TaxID=2632610 RepID=UPI0009F426F5|nr:MULTISPECIES: hypothetical protein [unclassified Brucella]
MEPIVLSFSLDLAPCNELIILRGVPHRVPQSQAFPGFSAHISLQSRGKTRNDRPFIARRQLGAERRAVTRHCSSMHYHVEVTSASASRVSALDRLIERPFFSGFPAKEKSQRLSRWRQA